MFNCIIIVQEYPQETVPETGGEKDNQDRLKVRPPEGQEEERNDSSQQEEEGGTSNTTSAVGPSESQLIKEYKVCGNYSRVKITVPHCKRNFNSMGLKEFLYITQ